MDAAEKLGCAALPLDRIGEALADAHLLVSAISSRARVIEPSLLSRRLFVLDANYGRPTALLEDAAQAGCTVIDGREWLLAQAVPAFTLFTDRPAPVDLMRKALWKTRRDGRKNIALIGFMGAGKSAVARELGILTGMAVVDIDKKIEETEGCSIAEIFERRGEGHFRRMEQAEIDELRLVSHHIVSCGGGAATNRANVRVLRNNCLSVWLWADVLTALARIGETATRPLLGGESPEAAARALLAERISSYARTCDLLINTKGKEPGEIAGRVWDEVRDAFAS
jgi:shikimate kinase